MANIVERARCIVWCTKYSGAGTGFYRRPIMVGIWRYRFYCSVDFGSAAGFISEVFGF